MLRINGRICVSILGFKNLVFGTGSLSPAVWLALQIAISNRKHLSSTTIETSIAQIALHKNTKQHAPSYHISQKAENLPAHAEAQGGDGRDVAAHPSTFPVEQPIDLFTIRLTYSPLIHVCITAWPITQQVRSSYNRPQA